MVDLRIIAFLGLILGNLIRQVLPFIRIWLTEDKEIVWDRVYTRRLAISIIIAIGFAYTNFAIIVVKSTGIWDTFAANTLLGINENWLVEEFSKWEWQVAQNRIEPTTPATTPS